jgi:hypothetical protein
MPHRSLEITVLPLSSGMKNRPSLHAAIKIVKVLLLDYKMSHATVLFLVITIKVKSHEVMRRRGSHIF